MEDNKRANRAGALAQKACRSVFGVSEPEVEVKSSLRSYYRVKIPLRQLEEQWEKDYVIVIYDCVRKRITRGPRKGLHKHTLTIEQAFKKPLVFCVIPGVDLMKLIADNNLSIQFVQRDYHRPPKLSVSCPIRLLKKGNPVELEEGHLRYGPEPSVVGGNFRDAEPPF